MRSFFEWDVMRPIGPNYDPSLAKKIKDYRSVSALLTNDYYYSTPATIIKLLPVKAAHKHAKIRLYVNFVPIFKKIVRV